MSKERPSLLENPFVRGGIVFVGVLIIAGVSIGLINEVLALGN